MAHSSGLISERIRTILVRTRIASFFRFKFFGPSADNTHANASHPRQNSTLPTPVQTTARLLFQTPQDQARPGGRVGDYRVLAHLMAIAGTPDNSSYTISATKMPVVTGT
jgi:hypothetical protein